MAFERRDIVLIAGLFLFMLGLLPFMGAAYAAIIVIIMYFGIKLFVARRKQTISRDIGEGLCMECGSKLSNNGCPNCPSK